MMSSHVTMTSSCLLVALAVLLCMLDLVYTCSVVDFKSMSMEKIMYKADIVVYGAERSRVPAISPPEDAGGIDASMWKDGMFEVYCVLKRGDYTGDIPEMMRLLNVEPINTCQGTRYDNNTDIILAVTPEHGHFAWHELNVTPDNMAFKATDDTMATALTVCGLQEPELPTGRASAAQPTCPADADITVTADTCINSAPPAVYMASLLMQLLLLAVTYVIVL